MLSHEEIEKLAKEFNLKLEEYIFPEYKKIYIGTYKNWFFEFKYDLKQDLWTVEDRVIGFDQDLGVVRVYFNIIGRDCSYEECAEGYRNYIKQKKAYLEQKKLNDIKEDFE